MARLKDNKITDIKATTLLDQREELKELLSESDLLGVTFTLKQIVLLASNFKTNEKLQEMILRTANSEKLTNFYKEYFMKDWKIESMEKVNENEFEITDVEAAKQTTETVERFTVEPNIYSKAELVGLERMAWCRSDECDYLLSRACDILAQRFNLEFHILEDGKIQAVSKE